MPSLNEALVLGHLGADPELRSTPGGHAVCNFSMATSYKPKEGQEQTEWHRIIVWGVQAENCAKYLKKGSLALVKGRLQTRKWRDEKDGIMRYTTEIVAFQVLFLDRKGDGSGSRRDEPPPPDDSDAPPF